MTAQPSPSSASFSHDNRHSSDFDSPRGTPSTALLIEYYENVATKGPNMPSVRVRVNPYSTDTSQQQSARTSYISPLPTRENTVINHQRAEPDDRGVSGEYEERQDDSGPPAAPSHDQTRGRQRSRAVSGAQQTSAPPILEEEEEEPLPAQPYRHSDRRDITDPSVLPMNSSDIVSSRQFQAIIASAIQELILPEIQAVRNELTAQAQLFQVQPGLNQASNQATFGTSTSGRKRSRSLTALDAPLHRRNSMSIGTNDGYHGEVVPLPPRPQSPNVPAALEAESLMRADLRSELKLTPPGTANREARAPPSNRLSGFTEAGQQVMDPSSHTVFNLAEGAYKKRESHEERMNLAKARRAAEKQALGEQVGEGIPEGDDFEEEPQGRTRFSMITADRAESDIHDFIQDETESLPRGRAPYREADVTATKSQLDEILEHLKQSSADRSDRENDILAQVSVLAENTHRSLQQLKDTILEETNVTVGALSYNIERYVGRVVQGPRPLPAKGAKALGKSASYPQDKRTEEHIDPPIGPMRRTTTFLQGIGQALTPAPGRAERERREGMERLEGMMQRVLEEVEMLKRMKQGARRKTNGEMFKGDYRNRLNPPEDAVTYIDEIRGDAANRERGESDEERMARIERSAQNFEEERNKRTMMQDAIATETDIIRQSSKDVRTAQQPVPETSRAYIPTMDEDDFHRRSPTPPTPLRMGQVGAHPYTVDPTDPIVSARAISREENESPSDQSFAHGDEGMFSARRRTMHRRTATQQVGTETAKINQIQDGARKVSVRKPVGLPPSDGAVHSASRESGVLGDHLEGQLESGVLGEQLEKEWEEAQAQQRTRYESPLPPPRPAKEKSPVREMKSPSPLPPMVERATPDSYLILPQRQRSQYFVIDQYGRRQYFIGEPGDKTDTQKESGADWISSVKNAVTPKKNKDKGKAKEIAEPVEDPTVASPVQNGPPQVSLSMITDALETSPGKKLKKKFRKPITTPFGIKESPVTTPRWPVTAQEIELPGDDLPLDNSPKKKARKSWRAALGFSQEKQPAQPQEPATLRRQSQGETVTLTYPGPSQEVRGRNGVHYHEPSEIDVHEVLSTQTTQPQTAHTYRDSISDSVREEALYSMKLGEELAQGRHPASLVISNDMQTAIEHQGQQTKNDQTTPRKQVTDDSKISPVNTDNTIGPFARNRAARDFTPTPAVRNPMPAAHLIPDGLLPDSTNVYGPTEPLTPQKRADTYPSPSPSPREEDIYDAAAIRNAFNKTLQRKPTPPKPFSFVARTSPRKPSNLAGTRGAKQPSTLKQQREQLTNAELGQVSPSKTDSSYKTAHDTRDESPDEEQERADDGVRPPSVYSHDSIGGSRYARTRARTPPDTQASYSTADFSNSTRALDNPPAPAKYSYTNGSPRSSPQAGHLNKPGRVPSGPRVQPPAFTTTKPIHREDRYSSYSRPSFTASNITRPTSEETDEITTAIMGKVVKTDVRKGGATITPNWIRTKRVQEEVSA